MAIVEDGSTPAVVPKTAVGSVATASFSPPANSLLVAIVSGGFSSSSNETITVSDSGSHTWATGITVSGHARVGIYLCQLTTAPGSITVTAAFTGNAGDEYIAVRVLTGAATTQTGAGTAVLNNFNGAGATMSVTTTQTGSVVYGISDNYSNVSALTPNAATTLIGTAFIDSTNGSWASAWKSTSATGTPGATTFGGTYTSGTVSMAAALEILPQTAVAEGGQTPIGLAATGTAAKVAPTGGSCALGFTGTGVDSKAAPQAGRGAVGLAASAADTKHAVQAGTSALGATSTSVQHRTAAQGGSSALGLAVIGTPHKTAPNITGRAALGLASSGTAAKTTAEAGRVAVGLISSAIDRKLAPAAGAGALGLTSAATERKAAPQSGAALLGAAGTAVGRKAAAVSGVCAIGLSVTHTGQENRSSAYLGLVGLAGPVGKVAITTGVCAVGLSNAGVARKTVATSALAALAITGTGTGVKFFPPARPWPPRALSVVLTHSDLADTSLTRSYQATVNII
jgi:hypothetical protein